MFKKQCKVLSIMLIVAVLSFGIAALADVPSLSDSLFACAKTAIAALASGDYERAVTAVPFSDVAPGADEWAGFAEGAFSSLRGASPQTKYAVAYWIGNCWKIAVPVYAPDSDGIEVLVLVSTDGNSVSGYARATWGQIRNEYAASDRVIWNQEYVLSTSAVIESDES